MSSRSSSRAAPASVTALRAEAEALLRERSLQAWEHLVRGAPLDSTSLYRRHAALFQPEALEAVRQALDGAHQDPERQRALSLLQARLLAEQVQRQASDLDDAVANLEVTAAVEVHGRNLPYRQLLVELAREADAGGRRRLQAAAMPVLEQLNALLLDRQRRILDTARRLGCGDMLDLCGRVRQCQARALAPLAEEILQATERDYEALFAEVVPRETGLERAQARPCDLQYLVRGNRHSRYFEAARLMPSLRSALRGLGIDLEAQPGLTIDSEDRAAKSSRAACVTVCVPDDVRLTFRASGGPWDYDCLYHEMGHAQHYLNTREAEFEYRHLGSVAVSEAYAFLLEGWTASVAWLRRVTSMPDRQRQEFRCLRAFRLLYLARRCAARTLYELRLHGGDLQGARQEYRRLQERALRVPLGEADESRFLVDVDPYLYAAEYVRGLLLEATLERVLRSKYGETWFEHRGSGSYLARLWEKGGRHRPEELLEKLGAHQWSAEPLLQRARSLCASA